MSGTPLTLHLEPASDEGITGWIEDGRGAEQQFSGWLGLLTLLEQARQTLETESTDRGERR